MKGERENEKTMDLHNHGSMDPDAADVSAELGY